MPEFLPRCLRCGMGCRVKFFVVDIGGKPDRISVDHLKPAHVDLDGPVVVAQPPWRGRPPAAVLLLRLLLLLLPLLLLRLTGVAAAVGWMLLCSILITSYYQLNCYLWNLPEELLVTFSVLFCLCPSFECVAGITFCFLYVQNTIGLSLKTLKMFSLYLKGVPTYMENRFVSNLTLPI